MKQKSLSISLVILVQLFASCKSRDNSGLKEYEVTGEDGKIVDMGKNGFLSIELFTGRDSKKKVFVRGNAAEAFFYSVKDGVETRLQPQILYLGKPIQMAHPFRLIPKVDSATGVVIDGSAVLQGLMPVERPDGTLYKNFIVFNNLSDGPTNIPVKLCNGDDSCKVSINLSTEPSTMSINYPQKSVLDARSSVHITTNTGIDLVVKEPYGPKNTTEQNPCIYVTKSSSTSNLAVYDYITSINNVSFLGKDFKTILSMVDDLDNALNSSPITVNYLDNTQDGRPGKYLDLTELTELASKSDRKRTTTIIR